MGIVKLGFPLFLKNFFQDKKGQFFQGPYPAAKIT
jgi:hypothetical protein